jgi:hypothetical protein
MKYTGSYYEAHKDHKPMAANATLGTPVGIRTYHDLAETSC